MKNKIYDSIIVGSGPGGAITSYHLAEASDNTLILEAGEDISLSETRPFSLQEMLRKYWNGGTTVSLGKPKISYVAGKCVGGGSEVNSGLYHRIPENVIKQWKNDYVLKDVSEESLERHYEFCEEMVNVSFAPKEQISKASKIMADGAKKLGWKCLEVPRWYRYDGKKGGVKQSMTETFLKYSRKKIDIVTNKTVKKLKRKGGFWHVKCHDNSIYFAKKVFLCAGAVQTPSILMRSGLGHNVGKQLEFHPTVKATAEFSEDVNSSSMGVPVHQVKEFSPLISMGGSISSLPYLSLALSEFPQFKNYVADNWKKMAIYYSMIRPETSAKLKNIPFSKDPLVLYQLSDKDLENLRFGLKELCRLLFAAGAKRVFPSISSEECILSSIEEFDEKIPFLPRDKTQLMTIHLFGSCPMGENKSKCVTDSFGKVHGEENLFINDASLLCTSLGVNPQGGLMAIARRNILHHLEKL